MNKEKFNIIYKHFAKPIAVNPEVSKCFQALMDALKKQLDSYRK